MNLSRLASSAFRLFLTAALLGGCAGEHGAGSALPSALHAAGAPAAASGDLLYVAHNVRLHGGSYQGVLSVLTFPKGRAFEDVRTPGIVSAICADPHGDVWAVVNAAKRWDAYEYAHGGTAPIARIRVRNRGGAPGCAVDPATGDLAVVEGLYNGSFPSTFAYIWPGARQGKPRRYTIPFTPNACVYDSKGALFVNGYVGDTVTFELGKLARGANAFTVVKLSNGPYWYPGGIAWDGRYVAVAGEITSHRHGLYRLKISKSNGKTLGIVHTERLYYISPLAINGQAAVATTGGGNTVALWPYPSGGAGRTIARYGRYVWGLAISVGSHKIQ